MSDVQVTPRQFAEALYFSREGENMKIECNYCNDDGFEFAEMKIGSNPAHDWVENATNHLVKRHPVRLGL